VEEQVSVGIGHTYAEPLWGLRVSWGSVLAGAVATIAVALILWSLAFAIVAVGATPTEASMRGSATALWISAMAATIIGAFIGGYLSGYLPGSTRPAIFRAHGFLSWCVAFLVSFLLAMTLARGAATMAAVGASTTSAQPTSFTQEMMPAEDALDPADPPGMGDPRLRADPRAHDDGAYRTLRESAIGMSWSWFGTWIIALGCAIGGASMGAARLRMAERTVE
jgi:hypothetical protein